MHMGSGVFNSKFAVEFKQAFTGKHRPDPPNSMGISGSASARMAPGSSMTDTSANGHSAGKASLTFELVPTRADARLAGLGMAMAAGNTLDLSPHIPLAGLPLPQLVKSVKLQIVSSTYRDPTGMQQTLDVEEINPVIYF